MNKINDQIIEWKNPDGKITKLNFDDDGKLLGKKSNEIKPFFDTKINSKYRYYEDLYGNQYRWTTHKQSDGKFKAKILKLKSRDNRGNYSLVTIKERHFKKKKSAIAWLLKAYLKAKSRQQKVLDSRAKRKQTRLDLKPKGKEKSRIEAQEKLKHFRGLSINVDRKRKELNKNYKKQLRSFATRQKTYRKKAKYYKKRVEVLK